MSYVQAPGRGQGGGRLAEELLVGQTGDGEAVAASQHVAATADVVVVADPGQFQNLEIPVDGALGRPQGGGWLRPDNGPEFIAEILKAWLAERGARPRYIDPGCPWQNPFAESSNGRLRDECRNLELSGNRCEAAVILQAWRRSYNTQRPHSSLGYRTPREYRDAFDRGGPRPAGE